MLYGQDRGALRRQFIEAWRKRREGRPLEPLEAMIAEVIGMHPEYHGFFEGAEEALDREFLPEGGTSNPFLHLGLHIALREQLSARQPQGVAEVHQDLIRRGRDLHSVEHVMLECLAETLWEAQRAGILPDEQSYLTRLRALR